MYTMSQRGNQLLQDVLKLSPKDRKSLIQKVIDSIDDATFKAELKRRRDEFLRDETCSVPWTHIYLDEEAN